MSYQPSEAAVEVVARALKKPLWDSDHNDRSDAELGELARLALVALMGATVPAEPCATCKGQGATMWPSTAGPRGGVGGQMVSWFDCEDCKGTGVVASPRSLPVVECEAAGLLVRKGAIPPYYDGVLDVDVPAEPLFFGAAPSTGSPT